ncbi:hypothetical protein [Pedobacter gandavensis]|uniref:hypothetical protein n=1 Tax=Pedobacter gandavensis TaxID=2679963 RepID=UPI002931D9F8|nr:hypothetical protein [Pedobacter gandavensis]
MKNKALSLTLLTLFATAVSGCSSLDLQEEIEEITDDRVITKEEFTDLHAKVVKDSKYNKFKDAAAFYQYLQTYCTKKNKQVRIWNPVVKAKARPFNVNVFFENSYSMNGYVSQADLKSSLYNMLVNVKQGASTLNLHYINSNVIKMPGNNIQSFSTGLSPAAFKKMGGKQGTSDIADILKNVLSRTDQHNPSILISDFVFSPPKGKDALSYLQLQQVAVKDALVSKLTAQNLALVIFQMKAYFQGYYYDHKLNTIPLAMDRPYYIWFIGTEDQVKEVLNRQIINQSDSHLLNQAVFKSTQHTEPVSYKIVVNKGQIGDFTPVKSDELENAEAKKGEFGFSVAVNFRNNIRGLKFFTDPGVYQLSNPNYSLTVRPLTPIEEKTPSLSGFSHLLSLKTKRLQKEELSIKVLDKVPSWVNSYSSTDDSKIKTDQAEQAKTFGLKYLVNGVSQAFSYYPNANQNIITDIKIKINK